MEKKIYSFARERGLSERKVIDVSSGICPCGPSKKVRAAIRKAIRDIRFLPDPSLSRLRRTLSSKLGIDGDNIIFSNSVMEFLCLISGVFKPARVLAAGPLLDVHSEALSSSGAVVEHLDSGDSGLFTEGNVTRPAPGDAGLVFISQPNRVTGRLADSGWLDEVLDGCGDGKRLAVLDESLIEFSGDQGNCERAAREGGLIVLRSTSNFYGLPGLGLAYAVSSPEITDRLNRNNYCEVNILAAAAARSAERDKTYVQTARQYIADERKFLVKSLEKIGGFTCYDSDSNVLLVKSAHPANEIKALLARNGFLISLWQSGETFLRVSVMEHEKNLKFLRILRQCRYSVPGPAK